METATASHHASTRASASIRSRRAALASDAHPRTFRSLPSPLTVRMPAMADSTAPLNPPDPSAAAVEAAP